MIICLGDDVAGQSQNGSPSNPLANLLGQYNSDSEHEDDSRPRSHALNDQVNDFLKVLLLNQWYSLNLGV